MTLMHQIMIWTCAVYGEAATSMRVTCGRAQSSRFTSLALWPVLDLGPAMRLPLPSRLSRAKLKLAAARRCALTEPLTEYCISVSGILHTCSYPCHRAVRWSDRGVARAVRSRAISTHYCMQ